MTGMKLVANLSPPAKRPALRAALLCAIATTGLALGACAGDYRATPGPLTPHALPALGQANYTTEAPASYRLGANDSVQIRVYGEPDLSSEKLLIDQSGTISMPFVGAVRAAGLTTQELAAALRQQLRRHIVDPQVAVNLVEFGSQRITVEGSLNHPGVFEVPPGTTLLGALAIAGDPDRFARARQIVIFRTDATGRSLALFDLHAVRAGQMIDPVLQANDRVVVGVSGLSRAYQDFLQLIPAAAIFSRF